MPGRMYRCTSLVITLCFAIAALTLLALGLSDPVKPVQAQGNFNDLPVNHHPTITTDSTSYTVSYGGLLTVPVTAEDVDYNQYLSLEATKLDVTLPGATFLGPPPPDNAPPEIPFDTDHYSVSYQETLTIPVKAYDTDGNYVGLEAPSLQSVLPGATFE